MPKESHKSIHKTVQEKLKQIPGQPGVYLFKDKDQKVLYVGKAKVLRSRVKNYFQKAASLDARKNSMMRRVSNLEYTVTSNEFEALVLEANLIKQFRPRFNVLLRDDKSYPYLKIALNEKWPRLEVVRRIRKDGARYFGPYVPAGAMWTTLAFIKTHFPVRTCRYSLEKPLRPCIQYQIKRCLAPCAGLIDHDSYMEIIREIVLLLEGRNKGLLSLLQKKMNLFSREMKYEAAALVRDRIRAIRQISESQKVIAPALGDVDVIGLFRKDDSAVFKLLFSRNGIMIGSRDFRFRNVMGENDRYLIKTFIEQFYGKQIIPPPDIICSLAPEDDSLLSSWLTEKRGSKVKISVPARGIKKKLLGMAEENARLLHESPEQPLLQRVTEKIAKQLCLSSVPEDIGAFDISNISGHEAVGAFVYWTDCEFRKDRYRHIRMDAVRGPDDYAMMKEMIKRTLKSFHGFLPDLVIVDGGKGHLEAALQVFSEEEVEHKDIVAVAKDPDRVFVPGRTVPFSLEDGSPQSLLLKKIRDEAHRFAISYHKKLRSQKTFESPIEKVPGIGKKRRFELLRHFGSIDAIRNSTAEEIAALKGFNAALASQVLDALKGRGKG